MDLKKWNELYKEKTGFNGNKYNRHQGIFVIGTENISTKYSEPLSRFKLAVGEEIANEFLSEFNNCDALYGEDAGYIGEFVFAVRNKDMITDIQKLSQ